MPVETKYAKSGDVQIADQIGGNGPLNSDEYTSAGDGQDGERLRLALRR